jgi:hypothetical protein
MTHVVISLRGQLDIQRQALRHDKAMDPEENKYYQEVIKVSPYYWTTEFKEVFLELALNYGEAN